MKILKIIFRSLIYYRRMNLATFAGTAISAAILTGALIVGDSVRGSLTDMVYQRLGNTAFSLELNHRFYNVDLVRPMQNELGVQIAPLFETIGIAIKPGLTRKARRVQIVGLDSTFDKFADLDNIFSSLTKNEIIVNTRLASELQIEEGDEVLLRIEDLDFLPKDTPLMPDGNQVVARRYRVQKIVGKDKYGHFSLRINQVVPNTVFILRSALLINRDLKKYANTMLFAGSASRKLSAHDIEEVLKNSWKITDADFELEILPDHEGIELRTRRIFFDSYLSKLIHSRFKNVTPVFSYFVNSINHDTKNTPYSFITAPGAPIVPESMHQSDILINSWLAEDLDIQPGDSISLQYYIPDSLNQLVEKEKNFKVQGVVPLKGIYADTTLMPRFPGLADVDNCRDWEPGIPIDLDKIREKDEKYWDKYKGLPKAFVTISAAQAMWQNRFGNLTALRFNTTDLKRLEAELSELITPEMLGFVISPVRQQGLEASAQSVDFSQLFLGLSFFIIISALLLTSLLFSFSMENRSNEVGLYFALGFSRYQVMKLFVAEGIILAAAGSLLGIGLSILYTKIILAALGTVWQGAVGTAYLNLHIKMGTLVSGFMIGFVIALMSMLFIIYRNSRSSPALLQSGTINIPNMKKKTGLTLSLSLAFLGFIAAMLIIITTDPGRGKEAASAFFAVGFCLLISGLAFTNYSLQKLYSSMGKSFISLIDISIRNTTRHRLRSLTLTGVLASSLFIVFTVGANRNNPDTGNLSRSSGTGGFAFFAETTLPIQYDLNFEKNYNLIDIDRQHFKNLYFVPFRLKDGDDASCLNLNRISQPRLLGVNPRELYERKAFSFISRSDEAEKRDPWSELQQEFAPDVIPGIADETVIIWGLGKSVGDTITYIDERGKFLRIKLIAGLANSIFQGNIIISEQNFIRHFPSVSGYRILLVDCDPQQASEIADKLTWSFQDHGLELQDTGQRLAAFSTVENTYLSIFLILGGFGIILGTLGIGVVVMRSIVERRAELAILRALGFKQSMILKSIIIEHGALLTVGIFLGLATALVSVLPALLSPDSDVPIMAITGLILIIATNGLLWIYLAARILLNENLVPALRKE